MDIESGLQRTLRRIQGFSKLPQGWNYGAGVPLVSGLEALAHFALQSGIESGFQRTNAFPCDDGSLVVSFYFEDHQIDLRIRTDGLVDFDSYTEREDILGEDGLSLIDAMDLLQQTAQRLCLSGSFTQFTGIENQSRQDFIVPLYWTGQEPAESRSWTPFVPQTPADRSVLILDGTTQDWVEIPLSFGTLIPRSSEQSETIGISWSMPASQAPPMYQLTNIVTEN